LNFCQVYLIAKINDYVNSAANPGSHFGHLCRSWRITAATRSAEVIAEGSGTNGPSVAQVSSFFLRCSSCKGSIQSNIYMYHTCIYSGRMCIW
jgi:hypothetical protein